MTLDTDQDARPTAKRPRPRPAPRRRASKEQAEPVDVATIASQLAALEAKLAALESPHAMRYVASEPANVVGTPRVADDEELTDWQLRVRDKTAPTPTGIVRQGKAYNIAPRLYMKPDGTVVSLQGDDQNYSYYVDKKHFHALTDEEAREYLSVERPKIVKRQQERANLINVIRRAVALDPALAAGLDPSWERDLDRMTTAELQAQLDEIASTPTSSGQKRRMMRRLPRLEDADARAADAEAERLLAGVETTPSRTAQAAFEAAQVPVPGRAGGHAIEVTPRNFNQFA